MHVRVKRALFNSITGAFIGVILGVGIGMLLIGGFF